MGIRELTPRWTEGVRRGRPLGVHIDLGWCTDPYRRELTRFKERLTPVTRDFFSDGQVLSEYWAAALMITECSRRSSGASAALKVHHKLHARTQRQLSDSQPALRLHSLATATGKQACRPRCALEQGSS